jgi:hypothetical protein
MNGASKHAAWVVALAWVVAPVSAQDDSLGTLDAVQQARVASHERMREVLAKLAVSYLETDFYVGDVEAVRLRAALAELPESVAPIKLWNTLRPLAFQEMRLGNTEVAIEHFERALKEVLPRMKAKIDPKEIVDARFDLGVAYVRLGETSNCLARHTSRSCILPIGGDGVHVDQAGSLAAIEVFEALLEQNPEHARARWMLNLAYMTLGRWPDGVPERWRTNPEVFASDEEFPRFEDVARERGLTISDLAGGVIADDFDGDGLLDLVTTTMHPAGQMHYYKGAGDGSFVERTREAGLEGWYGGLNCTQGDYDNDGDLDILVLRGAWLRAAGRYPDSLLNNDGQGHFTDVTFMAGLGEAHYPSQTGAFCDYDRDGDLDLYIGNETDPSIKAPCQLFRNRGDGTFEDVAPQAGVENLHFAKAVSWGDVDEDGWPDIFVSNQNGPNRLYRNKGDGTFEDIAQRAGVTQPLASFPAWFFDYDQDGHLDVMVWSYLPEMDSPARSWLGMTHQGELPRLYKGDGRGGFRDVAPAMGLDRIDLPMGSNFGDIDGDGWPDMYLGTGYPGYDGLIPNVFYRNLQGKRFADVTSVSGMGHLQKGHGVAFADFDRDGDLDVFAKMGGAFPGDGFGSSLFENPGFGNHWIEVSLVGVRSNRFGMGARIRCEIEQGGQRRSLYKWVGSGGSFGASPLAQRIGLGKAERIVALEVHWPTTGQTQVFESVPLDRRVRVVEGKDEIETSGLR